MAKWVQVSPAGRVNVSSHRGAINDPSVAGFATGRLKANDLTRVHRDWKYEELDWAAGRSPSQILGGDFNYVEDIMPFDMVGVDGPAPNNLTPIAGIILFCNYTNGGGTETFINWAYQSDVDGLWRCSAEVNGFYLNRWTSEGQADQITGPQDWDFAKCGENYYIGSTGDPLMFSASVGVPYRIQFSHLLARMKAPNNSNFSVAQNRHIYLAVDDTGSGAFAREWRYKGSYYVSAPTPDDILETQYIVAIDRSDSDDHFCIAGYDVLGIYYTETYEVNDLKVESEPKRIGWAVGPREDFWFYDETVTSIYGAWNAKSGNIYSDGQDTFYNWSYDGNVLPVDGGKAMWWSEEADGSTQFEWKWKLTEAANDPENYSALGGRGNSGINYRIYAQSFGVAPNQSINQGQADQHRNTIGVEDEEWPEFFWTGPGYWFGKWSAGNFVPATLEDYLGDPTDGRKILGGYDPQAPAIMNAVDWLNEKLTFNGDSYINSQAPTGVSSNYYHDFVRDIPSEVFTSEKVSYGDGKGITTYLAAASPSRYVVCEYFRGRILSVPIDNPNIIEYSQALDFANRPVPYRIPVVTDKDDRIDAIKAYDQACLVFTKSHVMVLNRLPDEGAFEGEDVLEILAEGRLPTERKAISTVSYINSHFIVWVSNEGLVASDGQVVFNPCPDFNLDGLGFEMRSGESGRMSLVNNTDDMRLELYLFGDYTDPITGLPENTAQRWDFYYHDSHLTEGRYFKLRGPTNISGNYVAAVWHGDVYDDNTPRRGRTILLRADGTIFNQTSDYTLDDIVWYSQGLWAGDPFDQIRFDQMLVEVPGDAGYTYKTMNYSSGIESSLPSLEEREMFMFAGPRVAKTSLEDSSGQWVQPGVKIEMNAKAEPTWLGKVWLRMDSEDTPE